MKKSIDPIDVSVGERVRLRRLILGMSQQNLAGQIGVTFQQVQKYEKGTNRIGSSRLQMIADVLAVPAAFFFEEGNRQLPAAEDFGAIPGLEDLSEFLASKEGRVFNRAYMKIADPDVRQSVLTLVKSLAAPGAETVPAE